MTTAPGSTARPAAGKRSRFAVEFGGLAQGISLVAFPASESVFRAKGDGFGLSSGQYGQLFLPQVALAVVMSLAGGGLGRRFGIKAVLFAGLVADLISMVLLAGSALFADGRSAPGYPVLLVATGFLGAGFGLTVPSLNSWAAEASPKAAGAAVLRLNALLGLGTALAPVLGALFLGLGIWWGLAVLSGVFVLVTGAAFARLTAPQPPQAGTTSVSALLRRGLFWLVVATALAYGVVETMAGTWGEPLARSSFGLSTSVASVVLTVFWGTVTVGRVVFSLVEHRLPPRIVYRVLPWVAAVGLGAVLLLPDRSVALTIVVFAVVGIGCSALLPTTVSTGQAAFPALASTMSAIVIAAYQVGYGVAAFGVGPLQSAGVDLSASFGIAALVAVLVAVGAFLLTARVKLAAKQ